MIYFISGHLDLTLEEFLEHYSPKIIEAAKNGHTFVVGDARGADAMAQKLLAELDASAFVYHMFGASRNNCGFKTVGGFASDNERDEALTKASDYDIAWVRPGREKSGTAKNIRRRLEKTIKSEFIWP